ncbi:monocarboxylate transporter 11-like [Diadema antillarum]|uniref:monocarboxylate transporter 11-like n=1 Tax=Diadema antillarum TaxID=105358 RepID=UPI003A84DF82
MALGKESRDKWWIVVMIANFGIEFLHQGYLKSVGVLLPSIVLYFDLSYSTMGFILSLEYCTYSLAAPIWRILSKRINPRFLATVGGTGTGLAIVATYFCDSPSAFAVMFFLSGFFGAAVFQVAFVTLQQHCKEKFGAANAFAMMGTLLGGMLVPLLTAGLHQAYGLKGALLFLGAVSGENFAAVLTSVLFASGMGAVVAGMFAGKLYDITGSFVAAFRVLGALMGVGLALTGIFAYLTKIRPNTNSTRAEARQAQQSHED